MEPRFAALVVVLAAGCGEGVAAKATEPASAPRVARPLDGLMPGLIAASPARATGTPAPAPASTGASTPPAAPTPTGLPPIGYLEGWANLAHLFESLAAVDDGPPHDDVRIVQFGDSHTAADVGTGTFRHLLQARFGDGGRGFVSIGRPWKTYYQEGTHGGMVGDFEPARTLFKDGHFWGDGRYGLLGIGIHGAAPGSRAWRDVSSSFSHAEIAYYQQPQGGSFDVFVDGAKVGRVATRAPTAGSAFYAVDVPEAPHQIEVRVDGDGEVRVFGVTLDSQRAGVVVDSLGVNGAQIVTLLREDAAHFVEQLHHRAPDLVVLAYGTNEALDPDLGDADYERKIVDELGRIERAAPTASCLLLGPPDLARRGAGGKEGWKSWPRLAAIVAAQRRVAQAAKCGFYDQMAAMGGPGSMVAWASEPGPDTRASSDHVHMRKSGYTQLGTSFASDLMRAYDEWRAARGLPPTGAPATWVVGAR